MQTSPRPTPPAARPDTRTGAACPRCGAAHAEDQEYCLECGLRLPVAAGVVPRLGSAWRRRLRWYPGDWLWPALLLLGLAAAGAAGAIALTTRPHATQALVATSPAGRPTTVQTVATTATETAGVPTQRTTTETTPSPTEPAPPPPPPPRQKEPIEWPAARRGYTVVLVSVPIGRGRRAADEQAREAIAAGVRAVGVLESSDYSSLHPGYYVVFTGVRSTQAATAADVRAAQAAGYGGAYVRQVAP